MSRRLLYSPEVARDYAEAVAYYEALSPKAALGFEEAFGRVEAEIESGMVTHQKVFGHYHRVFVGRFPYHLYYRLSGDDAVITGLLYARFSPLRIAEALRKRT